MTIIELNDPVYGKHIIKEPILIDLINSKAIDRLKRISHKGFPKEFSDIYFTRQEHSFGVLILLDLFGASLNAKVAGLLHDVNHAAFSHTFDVLMGSLSEDHQDNTFVNFINNNLEIKEILKKHNFDIKKLENLDQYTLLELPAPETCVDRLDYSIREHYHRTKDSTFIKNIIFNLVSVNEELIFKNKESATSFAKAYMNICINDFNDPLKIEKKFIFIDVLRRAIELKLITLDDFLKDDKYITDKIYYSTDEFIFNTLNKLKDNDIEIPKETKPSKKRYVNPRYYNNHGEIVRLVETDKEYKEKIENYLK